MTPQVITEPRSRVSSDIRKAFDLCTSKTLGNLPALAESNRTWAFDTKGDYPQWNEGFFEIGNWTTSFFTGMGVLAWLDTENEQFISDLGLIEKSYIARMEGDHAKETMHDLGFLYSLYSVALYKTTGESVTAISDCAPRGCWRTGSCRRETTSAPGGGWTRPAPTTPAWQSSTA